MTPHHRHSKSKNHFQNQITNLV